ncbi:MAG: hypothetical protein M1816_008230 [Peltula sp. TS41687]|nr:MAG: hypothetical protein M1816_008230 [Peltula sp. TS41687]
MFAQGRAGLGSCARQCEVRRVRKGAGTATRIPLSHQAPISSHAILENSRKHCNSKHSLLLLPPYTPRQCLPARNNNSQPTSSTSSKAHYSVPTTPRRNNNRNRNRNSVVRRRDQDTDANTEDSSSSGNNNNNDDDDDDDDASTRSPLDSYLSAQATEERGQAVPFTPPTTTDLREELRFYMPRFPPRARDSPPAVAEGATDGAVEAVAARAEAEGEVDGDGALAAIAAVEARMRSAAGRMEGMYYHERELAQRYLSGAKVFFENEEEKKRVLALLVAGAGDAEKGKLGEEKKQEAGGEEEGGVFQEVDGGLRKEWVDGVCRGVYDGDGKEGGDAGAADQLGRGRGALQRDRAALETVARMVRLNGSYDAVARKKVVEKVKSLVMASVPGGGVARSTAGAASGSGGVAAGRNAGNVQTTQQQKSRR